VVLSRRVALRALSARCVSRVDGIPMRVLSTGDTERLLRGMPDESVVVVPLGGVVVVVLLSVCWLCVGVGAVAPVPSCVEDESVFVVVVDVEGDAVVELLDEESVVVEDDGVDIEDESVVVVVEDDGVVEGDVVTSPVDVACEPSFETRM
jgi:hypothetical protein